MLTKKILLGFIFIGFGCMSACTISNPPQTYTLLNKQMELDSPRFLGEMRGGALIAPIHVIGLYYPGKCIAADTACTPSVQQYLHDPSKWKEWEGSVGYSIRIKGLLPAGTKFHFYRIDIQQIEGPDDFNLMIDSGPFKGEKAVFIFDRSNAQSNQIHKAAFY